MELCNGTALQVQTSISAPVRFVLSVATDTARTAGRSEFGATKCQRDILVLHVQNNVYHKIKRKNSSCQWTADFSFSKQFSPLV